MSLFQKLKPQYYVRIKANLVPNTNKIHKFPLHKDQDFNCKAAILYVNTCNGMTIFKDREVKSKENTMVFFNADENHQGTTCTDEKYKIFNELVDIDQFSVLINTHEIDTFKINKNTYKFSKKSFSS